MAVNPENYFAGDGSATSFVFTFEYLDESDVKVSIDGVIKTQDTDYSFANATTILFTSAPADGVEIRIYRDTNVDELKSTFFAGSSIRAQDLNQNFEQNNFAVQEIKAYTWDNETQTIHSDETWVSSDSQIATTAAMDQRFQDEAAETILSSEAWISDDDHIATTAAIDARFQDELSETITSSEAWVADDDHIATTQAIEDRIDEVITTDITTDGTGVTIADNGDGTITLGLGSGLIDLDRIKAGDIITSAEVWANNDSTIATTAKIDDMIDAAITGDIAVNSTGLTLTNDGDGTITLGIGANSVDFDRIKNSDIITQSEQDAGSPSPADTNIFTALAAARRFDTLVQTSTPSAAVNWENGKTWLQNDQDLTLSVYKDGAWIGVASGGTFTNQPKVVYVDATAGDDNNDGHRISRPKQSIQAAIEQINSEITTTLTSGGSGYASGTYNNVPLTGGSSTGLTADITVSGGVVTSISDINAATLEEYSIGDVLSASNTNLGGTGSGLQITVGGDGDGQVIVVAPGVYQEVAPLQIKRRDVSIIGTALRSCIIHPTVATQENTLFEVNSGSFLQNLTLTGVKASGARGGNALDTDATYGLPTNQGWNVAFYNNATIIKSPYIQNCTNFSDSEISNSSLNPHNPAGGAGGDTDSTVTGGGLLIDGSTVHSNSPLRSMVCDSYTHVGLDGPGIFVTNNGYCQATSSYAFFNHYHIKCLNGGQANLAASTTDFGRYGLIADGRSTTAIFTATTTAEATDGSITFTIGAPTADPSWHGSATRPQSNMLVDIGGNTYPILEASVNGAGWDVTISRPDPADRTVNLGLDGTVASGSTVEFFLRSMIASSGHTMEYVGSGTNYSALPENGGVPDEDNQVIELNNGKIWTAITDHNGKFKLGDFFEVDQQTSSISVTTGSFAVSLETLDTDVNGNAVLGANLDLKGNEILDSTGSVTINDTLDLSSNPIVNVTDPTSAQDAATKNYVDSTFVELTGDTMTGPLLASNGANPAVVDLGFAGDPNTGLYSPGADQVAISTGGTGRLFVDSSGRLLVGTSSSRSNSFGNAAIEQLETTGADASLQVTRNSNNSAPPIVSFGKTRSGSLGGVTVVASGDQLGAVNFEGADGSALVLGAQIRAEVDGTPGADAMPGRITFSTNPGTVSATPVERLRITSDGKVGVGTTSPGASLHVAGTGAMIRVGDGERIDLIPGANTNDPSLIVSSTGSALTFASNGASEMARLDTSGRLLVGTSSAFNSGSNALLQLSTSGATGSSIQRTTTSSDASLGYLNFWSSAGECASISAGTDGTQTASTASPGRLVFSTTPSGSATPVERLRITSDGKLGLGTSSPGELLDVGDHTTVGNRTIRISQRTGTQATTYGGLEFFYNNTAGTTGVNAAIYYAAGSVRNNGELTFHTGISGSISEKVRIDASGNVGIGTTAPSAALHVTSASNTTALIAGGGTGYAQLKLTGGSTANYIDSDDPLHFSIGGSTRATLDSSGRLLVGTSSDITGGANFLIQSVSSSGAFIALGRNDGSVASGDGIGGFQFYGNDGGSYESAAFIGAFADGTHSAGDKPARLIFSTTAASSSSPTERMRISNNGFIDIPGVYNFTTANPANVNVDSTGGMRRSTSSKKYKTDIETLQDSYADALLSCRPVWYRSTCEADCPEHSYWGFIAEEVAAIDPRLVHWKTIDITYDEDGFVIETPCEPEPEGVAYDRFVPHLLNLIKRQGEAIAQLQAEVAALKAS